MSWLGRARFGRWVHFLALPLASYDAHAGAAGAVAAARGVLVAFAVLAFGYTLNALADRGMDRPAKNAFAAAGATSGGVVLVVALGMAALLACTTAPLCARLATGVSLVSGVVYSVGPRLKRFPVIGSLANLTNFVPLMWVGASESSALPRSIGTLAMGFACLLLQNQLIHEAADRAEDDGGGLRTSVMLLGPGASAFAAGLLGVAFVVVAGRLGLSPWLPALVYVAAVPLLLARSGRDERKMARLRVAHRVASVAFGAALFMAR